MKSNAITAATEAACLILSVDETIRNPESKNPVDEAPVGPGGRSMPPISQQRM